MVLEVVQVEQPKTETQDRAATTQTAAATTETNTTQVAETAQPVTTANDYSWLEKNNIKSEADLSAIFEREKKLQADLDAAKAQPPVNPYKTEFARVADELSAKGVKPETIARFSGLNVDTLDSKSKILTKLEIEMPTLTPQERLDYFEEKYGVNEENENILTDGQKAERKVNLEKDAAIASDHLKQFVYQALNPNQVDPSLIEKENGRKTFWEQQGLGKVNVLNEIKLPAVIKIPSQSGVQEIAHDFIYQVPAEGKQALLKEFNDTVLNPAYGNYFDQSEQGIANANATYEKMFWQTFGPEIAKKQMEHAANRESLIHEQYAKMINNTSFTSLQTDTNPDKSVSADKGMAGFMKKAR